MHRLLGFDAFHLLDDFAGDGDRAHVTAKFRLLDELSGWIGVFGWSVCCLILLAEHSPSM